MKSDLALFGGQKTITTPFKRYNSIGAEETAAVQKVLESGVLSKFLGCWDPDFYGGERVQEFEKHWKTRFQTKNAIAVNSNTSGLIAAVGAIGIEPGDEVIVSPWTMCASATCVLVWNAIPVFADIETDTFGLDPRSIEKNISSRTKAIIVTDIFGHAARLDEIMQIAKKHGLKVIEDCAQAPGAFYKGRPVGTLADIGVFSLNYHKHIHTGEGGVFITDNDTLAERMRLIRNHAEAVVSEKPTDSFINMMGFNFRLGEIEAAIGIEQLKKLDQLVLKRSEAGRLISIGLKELKGLRTPTVDSECTHVYYMYGIILDIETLGVSREKIISALHAEGIECNGGYCNIHLLPIYQKKICYGKAGFPWTKENYLGDVSYTKGICPNAEKLHDHTYVGIEMCHFEYSSAEVAQLVGAFKKVWANLEFLK
jgi:perosamine synthetase